MKKLFGSVLFIVGIALLIALIPTLIYLPLSAIMMMWIFGIGLLCAIYSTILGIKLITGHGIFPFLG